MPDFSAIQPATRDCSNGNCVDVVEGGDTFASIVSTRRPEFAGVPFDADEIVKFIGEVKAGHWDGLYVRAQTAVSGMVSTPQG